MAGLAQPTVQLSATSYTVAESAGAVTLTVQRTSDTNTAVGVDYATADGTATNGFKYTAVSDTLTFGAGETNKVVVVPILNNGLVDGTKNFRVILSNPNGGAIFGSRTNATVSITDNDVGIQFQFATYSVAEDAGAVLIGVVRGDDGTNAVTVDYATTDVTATNGLDYAGTTTALAFAGQERRKLISIPILNDSLKEANKAFRVTLSNPVGATLGSQKAATITIVDNDQGFQFELASYSAAEDVGVARISVLRGTDDTNATATVDYATADVTSTNGLDYTGATNTLVFAPGERVKLVTVPILNDGVNEGTKNFRVILSNPTGGAGAVLGTRTTASVNIVDNDPGVGFELSSHSVWENASAVTVAVLRGNDIALGPITVDYTTSDLTAKAGQDYQAVSGTVAFGENETVKSITIPILRNGLVRSATFSVTLNKLIGEATLGRASTTVNILDASGPTSRTVTPQFDTALTIRREGDVNILTWSGGGQLQRSDRPTGPWQTLTSAVNPLAVQSPIPTTFYRVTRPRLVNVYIPSSYDAQTAMPLVILLHGYTGTGAGQESYMQFQPLAEARGFLYCYPDGTTDRWGNHFWNGTEGGGDFGNTGVDDAGYLRRLIEEIEGRLAVDRKRIHLIGHSNGGRMAYRMACESAGLIAGMVSLAGMPSVDPSQCAPTEPVNILHIHGTADDIDPYGGGALTSPSFPANMPASAGALHAVRTWAEYNGASAPVADAAPSMNLSLDVSGLDTVITRYTNAPPGGAVELWTINGGSHGPTLYSGNSASEFAPRVIDWLRAHPKP